MYLDLADLQVCTYDLPMKCLKVFDLTDMSRPKYVSVTQSAYALQSRAGECRIIAE